MTASPAEDVGLAVGACVGMKVGVGVAVGVRGTQGSGAGDSASRGWVEFTVRALDAAGAGSAMRVRSAAGSVGVGSARGGSGVSVWRTIRSGGPGCDGGSGGGDGRACTTSGVTAAGELGSAVTRSGVGVWRSAGSAVTRSGVGVWRSVGSVVTRSGVGVWCSVGSADPRSGVGAGGVTCSEGSARANCWGSGAGDSGADRVSTGGVSGRLSAPGPPWSGFVLAPGFSLLPALSGGGSAAAGAGSSAAAVGEATSHTASAAPAARRWRRRPARCS